MNINIETNIKTNYVEIDKDIIFFDIDIQSPFFNERTYGLASPEKFYNFLQNPILKNLNLIKNYKNEEFILIKNKTLKELQYGKKTLKNLFINIEDETVLMFEERKVQINIKEMENIFVFNENTCEKLRTGEYSIIKVDYINKIILDVHKNCIYFSPIYELPFADLIGIDLNANGYIGSWPLMNSTLKLNDIYEKGYIGEKNYSLDLKQKFKNLKLKEVKRDSILKVDIFNCFLNNTSDDYNQAWNLATTVKIKKTNKNIDLSKLATLFLLKIKKVDTAIEFKTEIFWECLNVEEAESFQKVWLNYILEKDLEINNKGKKHKI